MKERFKYQIEEIDYKTGLIHITYTCLEAETKPQIYVSFKIPTKDGRYISGDDLQQFVLSNYPYEALRQMHQELQAATTTNFDNIDNTSLNFSGEGVYENSPKIIDEAAPVEHNSKDDEYIHHMLGIYSKGPTPQNIKFKHDVIKVLEELNILK